MSRVERNMTLEEAAVLVKEKGRVRTSFIESFYHVPWGASHAFDIAINTAVVPLELASRWVVEAATLPARSLDSKRPTTRQLDVDSVMQLAVSEKLKCSVEHL